VERNTVFKPFNSMHRIKETHGSTTVIAKDNKVTIRPNAPDCTVLVNGEQIMFECHLYHNDR
jgi:hypothetical protein